jgi:hypothetical protein
MILELVCMEKGGFLLSLKVDCYVPKNVLTMSTCGDKKSLGQLPVQQINYTKELDSVASSVTSCLQTGQSFE